MPQNTKDQFDDQAQEFLEDFAGTRKDCQQQYTDRLAALFRDKAMVDNAIETIKALARGGADGMEGADSPEFQVAEERMVIACKCLELLGVIYNPISGTCTTVPYTPKWN